jgi:hypothetical protein
MKSYECSLRYCGIDIVSNHIDKTPAQARYAFYVHHSFDESYREMFKYIKSKYIGEMEISHLFQDKERFDDMCKRRGIEFAYLGMTVDIAGRKGKIVGSNQSLNLNIVFDGQVHDSNCHPTWEITYYDNDGNIVECFKKQKQVA